MMVCSGVRMYTLIANYYLLTTFYSGHIENGTGPTSDFLSLQTKVVLCSKSLFQNIFSIYSRNNSAKRWFYGFATVKSFE